MPNNSPDKDKLEKLAEQIKKDQANANPAEKRVKVGVSFKKAVKKTVKKAVKKAKLTILMADLMCILKSPCL